MISGFLKPTGGTIRFSNRSIMESTPYKINRLGIGRTFQDLRLATQLTVYENVLLALEKKMFAFPTRRQKNRIYEILEKVSLLDKRNELAGEISYCVCVYNLPANKSIIFIDLLPYSFLSHRP